jgi:hypothetical protein
LDIKFRSAGCGCDIIACKDPQFFDELGDNVQCR